MKIKLDYQTNSSSASFVVYLSSPSTDIEHFKIGLKKLMDDFIRDEVPYYLVVHGDQDIQERKDWYTKHLEQLLDSVSQITPNTYMFSDWTSMLNSVLMDMPAFIKFLVLEYAVNGLHEYGINTVVVKVEED